MKKYIFAAAALLCGLFTGCTNDEIEIENYDQLTLNITTESMYEENGHTSSIKEEFRKNTLRLMVKTFIYDQDGNYVTESTDNPANTNPVTQQFSSLKYGRYTVVTVETAVLPNTLQPSDWRFSGTETLSTLQIDQVSHDVFWWAALGVVTKEITVNGSTTLSLTPKAIGNFIQAYFINFDKNSNVLAKAVGTFENISAYRLNPALSENERVYKEQSSTTSFCKLGSSDDTENIDNITLYTLASSINVGFFYQNSSNYGTDKWLPVGDQKPISLTTRMDNYLAYYYSKTENSVYSTFKTNMDELNKWYNERLNNDKEVVDTFTDPYLTWKSTVTQVQNYMSSNLKDYTMYRGDTGKAEAQDLNGDGVDETYRLVYGSSDALIGQINYYFTSQTSDLYETYAYIDYEAMSFAAIKEVIASRYEYLGEAEDGSYAYYISDDGVTMVYVWDLETYAVVDYESYDYLVNSSSAKGVLSTDAFVNRASDMFKADKLKKIVK